jgi:hypothetical protein
MLLQKHGEIRTLKNSPLKSWLYLRWMQGRAKNRNAVYFYVNEYRKFCSDAADAQIEPTLYGRLINLGSIFPYRNGFD